MLRLSFIVPFYNVEPYIEECIRSLYDQDIPQSEYEVICVDDCSPDGSRAIVERLQKEYPTLRLLTHTENKRQGGARNTGLKVATGRYVWFVDSDDVIQPNCLKSLLEQAESEDLDIAKFYYDYVPARRTESQLVTSQVVSGTELIFDVDTSEAPMNKCCTVWCQLIKKVFIEAHRIEFAECVQYEDDDYAYQLFAYAMKAKLIGKIMYFVRETPNSTTRRKNDIRRAKDMYAQSIRLAALAPKLAEVDARWMDLSKRYIQDAINNHVFIIMHACSKGEQVKFWLWTRKDVRKLRPYLSRKSYARMCNYLLWVVL